MNSHLRYLRFWSECNGFFFWIIAFPSLPCIKMKIEYFNELIQIDVWFYFNIYKETIANNWPSSDRLIITVKTVKYVRMHQTASNAFPRTWDASFGVESIYNILLNLRIQKLLIKHEIFHIPLTQNSKHKQFLVFLNRPKSNSIPDLLFFLFNILRFKT